MKGQFNQAIIDFNKVTELDSKYVAAFNNRGLSYYNLRQFDRAIIDFNKTISLDPEYVSAYHGRADAYFSKGQLDRAIINYNKAIKLDPKLILAYFNRGKVYEGKGQLDKAIIDYNKTIELNPELELAYNNLAWLYATAKNSNLRNGSAAINLAKKSIKLNKHKNVSGILDTLAAAYIEADKQELAFKTYERVMKLEPSFVVKYQKYLIKKGLYIGKVDGVYNTVMRNSLIACVKARCQLGVD
jgi:tetratricopeptide (TPR) repeat protein